MKNPFQFGAIVTGDAFCNRTDDIKKLVRAIENSEKLFIYSERRCGKTSLVQNVLSQLPKKKYAAYYIDLWRTDGPESFIAATAKAVAQDTATSAKKLMDICNSFFGRLIPSVSLDNEGNPRVDFGIRPKKDLKPEIDEVLAAPAKIAAQGKRKAVVVFDECQEIMEYDDDAVERHLRSIIQHQSDVAYVFLGSRKHLLQKMFFERARPLYRSAGHYPLPAIAERDWLPFIRKRFVDAKKQIALPQIHTICELTGGHAFYTQHLCHALWELTERGETVTEESVVCATSVLLDRESHAYTTLWESLTKNQQRLLKGLANEPAGAKPFSSDFTRRYGLRSASNAQRASEALIDRNIVDHENGTYVIVDRFLRLWIQRMF